MRNQELLIKDFTQEVYITHSRVVEIHADIEAAKEKIATLEQQARGELGFPAAVGILEVFNQKTELDKEKRQAAFNHIKDLSEWWLHGMQEVGLELLTRRQRAQGTLVDPRLDETDEELENTLQNFWVAFDLRDRKRMGNRAGFDEGQLGVLLILKNI